MRLFNFGLVAGLALMMNGCCALDLIINGKAPSGSSTEAAAPKATGGMKTTSNEELKKQAAALAQVGETTQTKEGLKLSLKGDFSFAKGKADLSPSAIESLGKVAEQLKAHPDETVTVTGYTDNRGLQQANRLLSKRRAGAVKAQLVKDGISADRITPKGMGDADPIAPNDTDSNRAKNRRTELLIQTEK